VAPTDSLSTTEANILLTSLDSMAIQSVSNRDGVASGLDNRMCLFIFCVCAYEAAGVTFRLRRPIDRESGVKHVMRQCVGALVSIKMLLPALSPELMCWSLGSTVAGSPQISTSRKCSRIAVAGRVQTDLVVGTKSVV
jgi:hypothetical protein